MNKNSSHRVSRLVSLLLLFTVSASYAYACLWPASRIPLRKPVQVEGVSAQEFVRDLTTHEGRAFWKRTLAKIKKEQDEYPFVDSRNDLAVALVHLGRVKEALPILEEVESKHPGQYVTAANLGTSYELSGDNQKALDWIKEAIKRYDESHYGTEWLHVKILEAKLALEKDPDWLRKHSVLGADFRADDGPQPQPKRLATDYRGRQQSLQEIERALIYQLHERLEFVKPPDPVVADLLFDLSNILALTRSSEHAKEIHALSLSYGPNQEDLVSNRLAAESAPQLPPQPQRVPSRGYLLYVALGVALLLCVAGFYVLARRRRLQQGSA